MTEPGSIHFCSWSRDAYGKCARPECRRTGLEAEVRAMEFVAMKFRDLNLEARARLAAVIALCDARDADDRLELSGRGHISTEDVRSAATGDMT